MLSEEFIAQQKERLLLKQKELEQELDQTIGNELPESGGIDHETKYPNFGDDQDDNAEEVAEYSANIAIKKTLEYDLEQIKSALEKIDSNSYGKCTNCGQNIAPERLKALPEATKCIKCA